MGLFAIQPDHARSRPDAHRRPDRGKTPPRLCAGGLASGLILLLWLALPAGADPLRIATWHGDFSRKGPALLYKELETGKAPDLTAVRTLAPDVLVLTDVDYDAGHAALSLLAQQLGDYPFLFANRPNTGMPTGRDIDGDGRRGGPRDAQGYGWFSGQGGMAIVSRYPMTLLADFTDLPWRDAPGSLGPDEPSDQRLSSSAHWAVRIEGPTAVTLLTLAATPPLFDGPEDRNGRRNHDEVMLWAHVLDGTLGPAPEGPVAVIGNLNLDPERGDGLRTAVQTLLRHPRLSDPLPGQPTVRWDSAGEMRISYILPDRALTLRDAGIMPALDGTGPHRLVWVDLEGPPPPPAPQPVPAGSE